MKKEDLIKETFDFVELYFKSVAESIVLIDEIVHQNCYTIIDDEEIEDEEDVIAKLRYYLYKCFYQNRSINIFNFVSYLSNLESEEIKFNIDKVKEIAYSIVQPAIEA